MSVSIATMGMFNPAIGTGETRIEYVEVDRGTSYGIEDKKRRPVIEVSLRRERKKKVNIDVSLIGEE